MTNYKNLPDYLEDKELKEYFIEYLIFYANNTNKENVYYALQELLELSDRQWHTYEYLDNTLKEQLEKYIFSVINLEDEKMMNLLLCIIPRIGLVGVFEYILNYKDSIKNVKVKNKIKEALDEYGSTVGDPYAEMNIFK